MFTGLIQAVGKVLSLEPTPAGARLAIDPRGWSHTPRPGESIAVSGVCLTLVGPAAGPALLFDAVPETLRLTTLGSLKPGSPVNLEPSLAAGDPIGGHFLQGHVEGLATVRAITPAPDYRLTLEAPPDLMPAIIPKGSVALDGVSLTIASGNPAGHTFEVALIPTTLERTTLSGLRPGDPVNLETDLLARAAIHHLRHHR
ncbi:MAG: riboflavin synthase [Phycisphaerales bacterium]